jgi:peptidoglycan DL-endopeptidase CwlO
MHASHRRAARALVTICTAVATTSILTAAPAAAEPSVDEARERLAAVEEKKDRTATQVRRLSKGLEQAQASLRQTRNVVKAHEVALSEIEALIVEEGEDELGFESLATASTVVRSPDPTQALEDAQADNKEEALAPATAQALEQRIQALRDREAKQDRTTDRLRAKARKNGSSLDDLRAAAAEAAEELDAAEARAREAARPTRSATRTEPSEPAEPSAPAAPAAPAASGGAAAAVAYAMAQVGDTYVYGASGPDSFDCSGLTMAAWAQGGVSLPRTSGAQMGAGTPVSTSALQPGDIVSYYSPVSHVGIYVGNGQIVHAANPRTDVQMAPVFSMPISGAVRPG